MLFLEKKCSKDSSFIEKNFKESNVLPLQALSKAMLQQSRIQNDSSEYGTLLLSPFPLIFLGMLLSKLSEMELNFSIFQMEFTSRIKQGFLFQMDMILKNIESYQNLKKKLENRRLDYDAKLNKMNKSKKHDPSLEEDVKVSKFKFDESVKDVEKSMVTFMEKEDLLLESLIDFADAQIEYVSSSYKTIEDLKKFIQDNQFKEKSLFTTKPRNQIKPDNGNEEGKIQKNSFFPSSSAMIVTDATTKVSSSHLKSINNNKMNEKKNFSKENHSKSKIQLRVLYDYSSDKNDELTIKKGEILTLDNKNIEQGWYLASNNSDKSGLIPSNYVELV